MILRSALLLFVSLTLSTSSSHAQSGEDAVSAVLDAVHRLASEADFEGYFDLYAPDAVFLGTDASERWSIDEFKEYARPAFDRGTGWTYAMIERNIFLSDDGRTAWFDERLENEGFGECRGTGVLEKSNGVWKVSQYNLTVPIPNALLRSVASQIRDLETDG
jgi:ketosteroid isomerase-like protein